MKEVSAIALSLPLMLTVSLAVFAQEQETADSCAVKVIPLLDAKKYAEAVEPLKRCVQLDPNYYGPYNLLGVAYFETKRYAEARDAWAQNARLKPDSDFAFGNLGRAYLALGQNREAAENLSKAIELNPNRRLWRDELTKAQAALDAPPELVMKQEAERDFRSRNAAMLAGAKDVKFEFSPIQPRRFAKGVLRPKGAGVAGNSIEPIYATNIVLTAYVTTDQGVKQMRDEQNQCFYKKQGEGAWSAGRCERAIGEIIKVNPAIFAAYRGRYAMPAQGDRPAYTIFVYPEGDKLIFDSLVNKAEFLPLSDTEFYVKDFDMLLKFVKDEHGRVTHMDWDGIIVKKID